MKLRILGLTVGLAMGLAEAVATERLPGPLFDKLGDLNHPITTDSPKAQRYFNQGVTFLYAFNHAEAIRSFRSAAKLDPECGMAWWGVAYAYGPHVNKPMSPEDTAQACDALKRAQALSGGLSPREQAYIHALAARYFCPHPEDRSALDRAFADAMRELVKQYPDDLDAQTFFAEALMNTMPWDYWTRDLTPKPETEEILAALRFVMSRDPNHPGANHFYIHAVEAGPNPELGLPAADRLLAYAPHAGHLVHMPAHIYMRVGRYADAVKANELASRADEAYIRQLRAEGFYSGVYYPHNLHFLWYALVMEGRSKAALNAARKAAVYAADNSCGPGKALEAPRLRSLPWVTAARFGRWDEVLKVPQPAATNDFLVDLALWHFSRGLALAGRGDLAGAEAESAQLNALTQSEALRKLDSPQFPASATVGVANHWLAGRVASARGDHTAAIARLREAVTAELALPYMEPAYWPFATQLTLGAALLAAGQPQEAEQVFREDLVRFPRNGWSLYGLAESLRRQGKEAQAELVQRQFTRAWERADAPLSLVWF